MTAKKRWQGEIDVSDLPEPYNSLASFIGLENTLVIAGKMGGTTLYLPKIDTLYRSVRDKRICDEFTGGNYKTLAKKYGLTEQRVRKIVSLSRRTNRIKEKMQVPYEQIKLF